MSILREGRNFSAVLTPHRSLNHAGFIVLMVLVSVVSLCAGLFFLSLGAWPVFGFFGLVAVAIYLAFRWNFREAQLAEFIELDAKTLRVRRVAPSGHTLNWTFNPYWVRIKTEYDEFGCTRLTLISHGKTLVLGKFLGRDARARFADAFGYALASHQG